MSAPHFPGGMAKLPEYQALMRCSYQDITLLWQRICAKWPNPRCWQRQACYDVIVERNKERGLARRSVNARRNTAMAAPGTFGFLSSTDGL